MTPERFVAKWRDATIKERSAAQEHFIDLCRLLDEPTPAAGLCHTWGMAPISRPTLEVQSP